jgi:hypothetical protein
MRSRWKSLIVALLLLPPFGAFGAQPATAAESTIKGTGAVTGTVTGPKPFTAAHVYLRGQEKPVTFMVFTAGGNIRRSMFCRVHIGSRRNVVASPR